jgi:hypothetical protein
MPAATTANRPRPVAAMFSNARIDADHRAEEADERRQAADRPESQT